MAFIDNPDDATADTSAPVSGTPIVGTSGDDLLIGTSQPDTIIGAQGDDEIVGRAGNDHLVGDEGGAPHVAGSDSLFGGPGDDVMFGDFEDPNLPGRADVMHGGAGNDQMQGGGGENSMFGGPGDDDMSSGPDASGWMFGGQGDDTIQARGGDFHLFGDAGDDMIDARGLGSGEVDGGAGNDTILGPLQPTGDRILSGGANDDLIVTRNATDVVHGDSGNDRIEAASTGNLLPQIDGGRGVDTLDLHSHLTIDLTDPANQTVRNIEAIDLSGPPPAPPGFVNTVRIDAQTVADYSGDDGRLRIDGDVGDTVNAVGAWQSAGIETVGTTDYGVYTLGGATLLIDPDLSFNLA
jgi:Ca2+-binding RTX toxin-like protein